MNHYTILYRIVLSTLLLLGIKGANARVIDQCKVYEEQVKLYSEDGNFDSPWFRSDFWEVLVKMQEQNCESYGETLNLAGYLHYSNNNVLKAKEYLFEAEKLIDKNVASEVLLRNQLFLGLVYVLEDDFNNAIIYFQRSLSASEKMQQQNSVADAKLNLGLAYLEKNDFNFAERYLTESLVYFEENSEFSLSLGYVYLNLARVNDAKNKLDQALTFCDKAEEVWNESKHRKGILMLNQLRYKLYHSRQKTKQGIPYLLEAMTKSIETDRKIVLSKIYMQLGEAYRTIHEKDISILYYKKALELGNQLPIDELTAVIDVLGEQYFSLRDKSDYPEFLDNIKNILISFDEEKIVESSKLFTNETYIDTLHSRTTSLENINIKNSEKIRNQFKTIGLILLLSSLVIWVIYRVGEERNKLNMEIKNQYDELKEANSKLVEYSNKIEIKNKQYELKNQELKNFAYVASHDLKSPLRSIISFVGLLKLKSKAPIDKKQLEYFKIIEDSGIALTNLINDLLEQAELESNNLKLKQINCNKLVNKVLLNLSEEIKLNQATIDIDKSLSLNIIGDEIKLNQVFQNLISNAIKYCESGVLPQIHVAVKDDQSHYIFEVSDNGLGVAEKDRAEIFNMFVKIDSSTQQDSLGIGLATCRRIIELHGGEIWVKSNSPQGSIFSFSIPKDLDIT